jgi:hypothetical protein
VEEQLSACLSEGQIAEFVQHDEVEAGQLIGHASLAASSHLAFQPVDQIDDIVEAPSGTAANARSGDRDGKMALPVPVQCSPRR